MEGEEPAALDKAKDSRQKGGPFCRPACYYIIKETCVCYIPSKQNPVR